MKTFLVAGLLLFPTYAFADGNDLLRGCGASVAFMDGTKPQPSDDNRIGFCLGFMQGVTQTNLVYQVRPKDSAVFCLPEGGVKNGQAARVFVKYLRDHPEELHRAEIVLAFAAFQDAFPCRNER